MGTAHTFVLPDVGEGLTEAEIVRWLIAVGDMVSVNDPLVEIETAKALVELPSPLAGRIQEILVPPGRTVPVGTSLVAIGAVDSSPERARRETAPSPPAPAEDGLPGSVLVGYGPTPPGARRRRLRNVPGSGGTTTAGTKLPQSAPMAKPPVRMLARRLGVDLADLVPGPGGLVTREQVTLAAEAGHRAPGNVASQPAGPGPVQDVASTAATPARGPTRGVQKAMAAAMVASAFTAPHATLWLQVDMTATMELVARLQDDPEWTGVRVTPLLVMAKAVLLAARWHPAVNSTWDDRLKEIVLHGPVNLGIATATPRGLLVPNLKGADRMALRKLAEELGRLVTAAREGRAATEDLTGGTLTITNIGVFGMEGATPILNPGEAAIVAFGAIRRMPWVVGDEVVIRPVSTLSLSIDHRAIDGEQGSRFLASVARLLEHPVDAFLYAT